MQVVLLSYPQTRPLLILEELEPEYDQLMNPRAKVFALRTGKRCSSVRSNVVRSYSVVKFHVLKKLLRCHVLALGFRLRICNLELGLNHPDTPGILDSLHTKAAGFGPFVLKPITFSNFSYF